MTDLREFHRSKVGRNANTVEKGDLATVYDENKKREEWRMAVVESLIKDKDDVVRGANIRVIAKGKPSCMSIPVQKLYPIEVQSEFQFEVPQGGAQKGSKGLRRNPRRAAATDARWKTNLMLDS